MNQISSVVWLDLVLVLFLIGGLMIGFTRGLMWEFIGLASLYIGTVIASQYYYFLADFLRQVAGHGTFNKLLSVTSFLFLLFLVALLVSWIAFDTLRTTKLKLFSSIDSLGGTVLGLASMIILIILLTPLLKFAASETWAPGWPEDLRIFLSGGLNGSVVLQILNEVKPVILDSLNLWVPSGPPSILTF